MDLAGQGVGIDMTAIPVLVLAYPVRMGVVPLDYAFVQILGRDIEPKGAARGPTQVQLSPMTAAGILQMRTVGTPGPTTGPPTWGMGEGTAGVCMGQVCISVSLAAGGMDKKVSLNFSVFVWPVAECFVPG